MISQIVRICKIMCSMIAKKIKGKGKKKEKEERITIRKIRKWLDWIRFAKKYTNSV